VTTPFYRYIRPQRFDPKRQELITLPRGGICLRFAATGTGDLWFTYSRCHPEDLFKKDVARLQADHRAMLAQTDERIIEASSTIPNVRNTDLLIHTVIDRCLTWEPPEDSTNLVIWFMAREWKGLAESIRSVYYANIREIQLQQEWQQVLAAAGPTFLEHYTRNAIRNR
jgi:hypothetical protein